MKPFFLIRRHYVWCVLQNYTHIYNSSSCPIKSPQVLAAAFSTEIGRLREAGAAAATVRNGVDGNVTVPDGGASEVKVGEVSRMNQKHGYPSTHPEHPSPKYINDDNTTDVRQYMRDLLV